MGDMSSAGTGRTYGLVYLVYDTIGNVITQDGQVRCFANAAASVDGATATGACSRRVRASPARSQGCVRRFGNDVPEMQLGSQVAGR
jgi:hypothetical protein